MNLLTQTFPSLRGRRLEGKGKGVFIGAKETRGRDMDRMRLKIEITTVYRLILLSPLSFTEYSQLENFRFGANVGM